MPVARLDDRAVVRIAGPDAATLLQNVVTLDVGDVDRHGSSYGALLTPQGKILWDFILHRMPDGYAADLRSSEVDSFIKRLTLYRLRAKADIAAAPELAVFAAWPASAARLAGLGGRWVAPAGSVAADATIADWHRQRIALAVPEGGVDFVFGDAFPHDAAMDSLHGVAFDKGCYIGQEVVSRMRHRGTARRRIVAVHADSPLPEPGAEIVAREGPLGRLGSSADGNGIALVRLDRTHAALDAGLPIRAGSQDVRVALPGWATYGWPAAAAVGED